MDRARTFYSAKFAQNLKLVFKLKKTKQTTNDILCTLWKLVTFHWQRIFFSDPHPWLSIDAGFCVAETALSRQQVLGFKWRHNRSLERRPVSWHAAETPRSTGATIRDIAIVVRRHQVAVQTSAIVGMEARIALAWRGNNSEPENFAEKKIFVFLNPLTRFHSYWRTGRRWNVSGGVTFSGAKKQTFMTSTSKKLKLKNLYFKKSHFAFSTDRFAFNAAKSAIVTTHESVRIWPFCCAAVTIVSEWSKTTNDGTPECFHGDEPPPEVSSGCGDQNAPLLCTRMHRYFAPECEKLYCKLLRLCIPQKNQDLVSETCTFRQSGAAYTHMKWQAILRSSDNGNASRIAYIFI